MKLVNIAERLCRLTAEGLYRDSILLDYEIPLPDPLSPGKVAGQDSIQAALYNGRVYWFWGDTWRMSYPLGLFRMAGATTPIPHVGGEGYDLDVGIPYDYFTREDGFVRAMMPLEERPEGVIWVGALCVVTDKLWTEKLVAHYSRRKGLFVEYEQQICVYNNEEEIFEVAKQQPLTEKWRRPSGHPIQYDAEGRKWLLFGSPSPNVRLPTTYESLLDEELYEAYTCIDGSSNEEDPQPLLDENGIPVWRWAKDLPPVT